MRSSVVSGHSRAPRRPGDTHPGYPRATVLRSATNPLQRARRGRIRLPRGRSEQSVASAWTTSSCWARRICVGSCESMLAITILRERTGHWTRMRRSLARFSKSDASCRTPRLAGCITNTSGFRFSARTAVRPWLERSRKDDESVLAQPISYAVELLPRTALLPPSAAAPCRRLLRRPYGFIPLYLLFERVVF